MKIISECPLCEAHSLHVIGEDEWQTQQCINCGYVTSEKFKLNDVKKEDHSEYKKLTADMKFWSEEKVGYIWIPTIMTLPIGMLYPQNIDNMVNHQTEMKWAFAPMVEIPEDERKDFPNGQGGFYEKRIDTENAKVYDVFVEGLHELNEKLKAEDKPKPGIKLPKLKKVDGK